MGNNLKYVHSYRDRHGKARHYFRHPSSASIPLPEPSLPDFEHAYNDLLEKFAPLETKERFRILNSNKTKVGLERQRARQSKSGVYLLMLENRIVYVGTSEDMVARVLAHRSNGRPFDRAFYIPINGRDRHNLERILIAAIKPEQNRV